MKHVKRLHCKGRVTDEGVSSARGMVVQARVRAYGCCRRVY